MNPLVSVLMPVYNCEQYVGQAIESILNQTHRDFELIICDDGSSDRSLEIINSYMDKRIVKYKNEINKGYLFTYNFLLSLSKGAFITCQDADDWSLPTRIEYQMDVFNNKPDVFLCACNGVFYYNEETQRACPPFESGYIELTNENFNFMLPAVLYKREVLSEAIGFHPYFDRLTGMDQYFILSIIAKYRAYEINDYLYYARFNPTSNHRTFDSLRKLTAPDAYFLLKKQRVEKGTDWLREGREDLLLAFEQSLMKNRKFMAEKLREYAVYRIDSNQIRQGLSLITRSLLKLPFWIPTYRTLFYAFRKWAMKK